MIESSLLACVYARNGVFPQLFLIRLQTSTKYNV